MQYDNGSFDHQAGLKQERAIGARLPQVEQRAGELALEEIQKLARELAGRVGGLANRIAPDECAEGCSPDVPIGLIGKYVQISNTLREALGDLSRVERVI